MRGRRRSGVSETAYHVQAITLGTTAGLSTLAGVSHPHLPSPDHRAGLHGDDEATTRRCTSCSSLAIVAGLATTAIGSGVVGEGHNYRETVSPWFRSLFVLQPDVAAMAAASLSFKVHALTGLLLFAIWPFTRLVHAFSAPIGYLFRPYVVYRSREVGRPASRPERPGWDRPVRARSGRR